MPDIETWMSVINWIYLILFVGVFPVLWVVAWCWDRTWPATTKLLKDRGEPIKDEDIPK